MNQRSINHSISQNESAFLNKKSIRNDPIQQLMLNSNEFEEPKGYLHTSFSNINNTEGVQNPPRQSSSLINSSQPRQQFAPSIHNLSPIQFTGHIPSRFELLRIQHRKEDLEQQIAKYHQVKVLNQFQKIMVQFYVKKFIRRLSLIKKRMEQLTTFERYLINKNLNDNQNPFEKQLENPFYERYFSSKFKCQKFFKRMHYSFNNCLLKFGSLSLCQTIYYYLKKIPLIQPESKFKNTWDVVITMIRIYFLVFIPIQLGFTYNILYYYASNITLLSLIILFIDIILNFNTAFYDLGQKVTQRQQISHHYLKNYFLYDFFTYFILIIPFEHWKQENIHANVKSFILIFFFIQFKNIKNTLSNFEESVNHSKTLLCMINLLKVLLIVLFSEHIFSCFWFFVGDLERRAGQNNWIEQLNFDTNSFIQQYIASFYYTSVTMASVGYGDITPQSQIVYYIYHLADIEKVVCIIFMLFASMQMSYSVSTVGQIIQELSAGEEEIIKKQRAINIYMQKKRIASPLQFQQFKVRQYLTYHFKQQQVTQTQNEQTAINQLSEQLRDQLLREANSIVLHNCSFFQNHFSQEFKRKIIKLIKEMDVYPGSIIQQQQADDFLLFFIEKGRIEISIEIGLSENYHIQTLNPGQSFGIGSFLTDQQPFEKYRSLEFSKLLYISKKEFLFLLKDFPEDYEEYCSIKDQAQSNNRTSFFFRCQICQGSHEIKNCPKIHYIPDNERIIKSFCFNHQQESTKYWRRKVRNKQNNYKMMDKDFLQELAQIFQTQNQELIQKLSYEQMIQENFGDSQSSTSKHESESEESEISDLTPQIQDVSPMMKTNFNQLQLPHSSQEQQLKKSKRYGKNVFQNIIPTPFQRASTLQQRRKSSKLEYLKFVEHIQANVQSNLQIYLPSIIEKARNSILKTTKISKLEQSRVQLKNEEVNKLQNFWLLRGQQMSQAYFERDFVQFEFYILKQKLYIEKSLFLEFDSLAYFKLYNPKQNVDQILIKVNQWNKSQNQQLNQRNNTQNQVYHKLLPYMFFPFNYYKYFKTKQLKQKVTIQQRRKKVTLKSKPNLKQIQPEQ